MQNLVGIDYRRSSFDHTQVLILCEFGFLDRCNTIPHKTLRMCRKADASELNVQAIAIATKTKNNKGCTVAEMSDRFATIDMGRKVMSGAAVPISVGRDGSLSNAISPGPRSNSVPSGILIHPTVWSQYTNVTDRPVSERPRSTVPVGLLCPGRRC